MAAALALLAVDACGPARDRASHAVAQRAPLTRLFPGGPPSAAPFEWDDEGRRVLWRSHVAAVADRELVGLETTSDPVAFRRRGPAPPAVLIPVSHAVAASEVALVRVTSYFPAEQERPPRIGVWLRILGTSGTESWLRCPSARARRVGLEWVLETCPSEARPKGTLTAVRLEISRFAGDTFSLGNLDLLGAVSRGDEGFVFVSDERETRPVWAVQAGRVLTLRGRAPAEGRLLGEVRAHPACRASAVLAEVTVAARGGAEVRRTYVVEAGPMGRLWTPYDIPLGELSGREVSVRIAARAAEGPGLLWTEPVLAGAPGPATGIVLISVDTLRADAVFPLDGHTPAMPLLAARARREGQVVFHHYAAATWTLPSHASLLSGRYPSAHGADDAVSVVDLGRAGYLPLRLARRGFYTAGIVGGLLVSAACGFHSGFDRFAEATVEKESLAWNSSSYRALLPRIRGNDFFLFLHSYFVHEYYHPKASGVEPPVLDPDLARYYHAHEDALSTLARDLARRPPADPDPRLARLLRIFYAQRAAIFDRWLDGFLDGLARDFDGSPPIVVLTADHGEGFGDGPRGRAWHHGGPPDEALIRVPLVIFHGDRRARPPIMDLTSAVDLVPTLLKLARVPDDGTGADGLDITEAGALAARREVYSESDDGESSAWAAVGRGYKLVAVTALRHSEPGRAGRLFLRGSPGAFDEARPAPAAGIELRDVERRRLEYLHGGVDGLFVQVDNPTRENRVVDLTVAARAAPDPPHRGTPRFQAHLLEPDDSIGVEASARRLRFSFSLPPGDTDLVVFKGSAEITLAVNDRDALLSVSGRPSSGRTVLVGRLRTPPLPGPPALPALAVPVVRVWENEPPGAARLIPRHREILPDERERLRALGYVN